LRSNHAQVPLLVDESYYRDSLSESRVKKFRPQKLGVMKLKEGPATLTLQASKIPGTRAIDFRLLMFTKVE
jgi:hypothetical protein